MVEHLHDFKSKDSFLIEGRGRVYIVSNPRMCRSEEIGDCIGSAVVIDGVTRTVRGVERHALPIIRKGANIGILVGGQAGEK